MREYPDIPISFASFSRRSRIFPTTDGFMMEGGGGVRFTPVPPWNFSSTERTSPSATVIEGLKAWMPPSRSTTPTAISTKPLLRVFQCVISHAQDVRLNKTLKNQIFGHFWGHFDDASLILEGTKVRMRRPTFHKLQICRKICCGIKMHYTSRTPVAPRLDHE